MLIFIHSPMSNHVPGFPSFFSFFASFCIRKRANSSIKVIFIVLQCWSYDGASGYARTPFSRCPYSGGCHEPSHYDSSEHAATGQPGGSQPGHASSEHRQGRVTPHHGGRSYMKDRALAGVSHCRIVVPVCDRGFKTCDESET